MKNSVKSYVLNFLLILLLTIVALWFSLKDQYREVILLFAGMKWYSLAIVLIWGIVYACVVGCILTVLAKKNKKDYRYIDGITTGFIGMFFNGITPSSTGGQFAQAYIFKKQGIKISDAASILWADFIIYQTTMMIYVTILFMMRFSHFMDLVGVWFWAIFIGYIINIFVILFLWTVAFFPKVYTRLSTCVISFLARIHIIKNKEKVTLNLAIQVDGFIAEIKRLKHEKDIIIKTVFLNIVRMTLQFILPFCIMRLMFVPVGMDRFVDCLALSSFVLMANAFIPVPGASGGTELIFTALFQSMIQSSVLASGVMILWRFSTYHIVMIVGAVVFLIAKHKFEHRKYHKQEDEVKTCE